MPPEHPLAGRAALHLADLLPYDVIGARSGSSLEQLVLRGMQEVGQPLRIRVRISGFETLCRMAEAHLGVGLVPHDCAMRHCSTMKLVMVALDETWAERELNLCTAAGQLPPQVRMLVEHLRASA